jgi:hypothetical protein
MPSNDRLRRREERDGLEPHKQAAAPAPPLASILAMQRTAGNRAVQRMLYTADTGTLLVPPAYGAKVVPWEGPGLRKNANPQPTDPTLENLAATNATFRGHLKKGMNVPTLNTVTSADERTMRKATWDHASSPEKDALAEARAVAPDPNRLLHFRGAWHTFEKRQDLDVRWVIPEPKDFVPSPNDLIPADKPLSTWTGEGAKTNTGWKMACVLIALLKHEDGNLAMVTTITTETPASFNDGVQKLHKYYAGHGVLYDDTATRFELMNRWNYKPIFTTGTTWADLPKHVALTKGKKYIFDIVGHTVVVRAKQDIAKDPNATLADPAKVLEPDSLEANYKRGTEFNEAIKFIWEKQ